jgi:hypothetical protein
MSLKEGDNELLLILRVLQLSRDTFWNQVTVNKMLNELSLCSIVNIEYILLKTKITWN